MKFDILNDIDLVNYNQQQVDELNKQQLIDIENKCAERINEIENKIVKPCRSLVDFVSRLVSITQSEDIDSAIAWIGDLTSFEYTNVDQLKQLGENKDSTVGAKVLNSITNQTQNAITDSGI